MPRASPKLFRLGGVSVILVVSRPERLIRIAAAQCALLLLFGCAHRMPDRDSANPLGGPRSIEQVLSQNLDSWKSRQIPPGEMRDQGEITVRGVKLKNTRFDIPISINSRVEYWVDYFTGKETAS
jgi:hypothetical protein